jgi:hypothetical protein
MVMFPSGGSLFHKVIPAGGVIKDAEYLKKIHLEAVDEVTKKDPSRCLGITMDNTKANRWVPAFNQLVVSIESCTYV